MSATKRSSRGGRASARAGSASRTRPPSRAADAAHSNPVQLAAICALLVVIVACVFFRAAGNQFLTYDDDQHVYGNKLLNPLTAAHVLYFWVHPLRAGDPNKGMPPYEQLYAPVFFTVLAALAALARMPAPVTVPGMGTYSLDPQVFHAANVVLHVANVLLVFAILRLLVQKDWACAAGALLFGVHPVQVEPVSWVTGLNNLLSGTFGFAALWLYLLAVRPQPPRAAPPAGRRAYFAGALVLFVLALLTKPISVVFLPIAWILDFLVFRRSLADTLKSIAPGLAPALVLVMITKMIQPDLSNRPEIRVPDWFRLLISADSYAFYLGKLFWPIRLCVDYGRTPHFLYIHQLPYRTLWIPVALAVVLWLLRKRYPMLAVCGLIFAAGLFPMSGIVPYYFHSTSVVADRYLYLALLAPALALAWIAARLPPAASVPACAALICVLCVLSYQDVAYWRDSETLYRHTLAVNPRSDTITYNYGTLLALQGRDADATRILKQAISIDPSQDAQQNLGVVLYVQGLDRGNAGDMAGAASFFRQSLQYYPDNYYAHFRLGLALAVERDYGAAESEFRKAVGLKPDSAEAHFDLAAMLQNQHKLTVAKEEYQETLRLQPGYPQAQAQLNVVTSDLASPEPPPSAGRHS